MKLLCQDCGNKENFLKPNVWESSCCDYHYDGNGEYVESTDSGDFDNDSHHKDFVCWECESENIVYFDNEKDRDLYIWEHTDQDEVWSEEILPEDERSDKIRQEIIARRI